jgi:cysteine sulfinate desulfinase/cysteine desulfurase-like protein
MSLGDQLVRASLRFGIGRPTTSADIEIAINEVVTVVRDLRSMRRN